LQAIKILNFQSHKRTELDLSEGINIFSGRSDSGKSAILRAVRWVLTNRPRGTSFIRHGMDPSNFALVKLTFDNCVVIRKRNKAVNQYSLKIGDQTKQTFEAMGDKVPDEIVRAIAMDDLNVQFQHDAPFMLSKTAGDVAKEFNDLVNLNVIDTTLANLNRKLRATRGDLDRAETELKKAEEDAKRFALLNNAKVDFKDIDGDCIRLGKLGTEQSQLLDIVDGCEVSASEFKALSDVQTAENKLKELLKAQTDLSTLEKSIANLDRVVGQIDTIGTPEILKEQVQTGDKELTAILESRRELDRLAASLTAFRQTVNAFEITYNSVNKVEEQLKSLDAEWERVKPATCPLCGSKLK